MPIPVPNTLEAIPVFHERQLEATLDIQKLQLLEIIDASFDPETGDFYARYDEMEAGIHESLFETRRAVIGQLATTRSMVLELASGKDIEQLRTAESIEVPSGALLLAHSTASEVLRCAFDEHVFTEAEELALFNGATLIGRFASRQGQKGLRAAFDNYVYRAASQGTLREAGSIVEHYAENIGAMRRALDRRIFLCASSQPVSAGVHTIHTYASNRAARDEMLAMHDDVILLKAMKAARLEDGVAMVDAYASTPDARARMRSELNATVQVRADEAANAETALYIAETFAFGKDAKEDMARNVAESRLPAELDRLSLAQIEFEHAQADMDAFRNSGVVSRIRRAAVGRELEARLEQAVRYGAEIQTLVERLRAHL